MTAINHAVASPANAHALLGEFSSYTKDVIAHCHDSSFRSPATVKCPFLREFLSLKSQTNLKNRDPLMLKSQMNDNIRDTVRLKSQMNHNNNIDAVTLKSQMNENIRDGASLTSQINHNMMDAASLESQMKENFREVVSLKTKSIKNNDVVLSQVENRNTENMPNSVFNIDGLRSRYANHKSSILAIGLSVHTAPVEMREKLAVPEADWIQAVEELTSYPHVEEAGILSTCNRLEIYVVALSWNRGFIEVLDWMSRKSGIDKDVLRQYTFIHKDHDASRHLFRVASGLDSLVLGEGQILAQVRQVVKVGQNCQSFGRQLSSLFKQAITAGKRVRTETSIGVGSVSVSSAAVELVSRNVALSDARNIIIGAGKMAHLLIKHLISKGCRSIVIVNRSETRVKELQALFPEVALTYKPLQEMKRSIGDAEVIFTCTASTTALIFKESLEGLPHIGKPRHFVDISVPRNVSPCVRSANSAIVYNVDDVKEVIGGNKEERAAKGLQALPIIEEELKKYHAWQDSLETVGTIKKLRAFAENIRVGELQKCLGKMGENLSNKEKKIIEEMSKGIINKLLHGPMVHLRNDGENCSSMEETLNNMQVIERVFNLQSEVLVPDHLINSTKAKT